MCSSSNQRDGSPRLWCDASAVQGIGNKGIRVLESQGEAGGGHTSPVGRKGMVASKGLEDNRAEGPSLGPGSRMPKEDPK